MSADNYVVVKKFRDGWRWGCFFASDDPQEKPGERFRGGPFPTALEAEADAIEDLVVIEYGIRVEGA